MNKKHQTRKNCSSKERKIESGSWQRWLRWRGWQMIICKRPAPPDDHLKEAGHSGWSFAKGRSFRMIICKRLVPPDDHLQEAGPSGWSFARVQPLQNNNNNPGDNGSPGWQGWWDRRRRRKSRRKNWRGRDGIKLSTRGPRGPNKNKIIFCNK